MPHYYCIACPDDQEPVDIANLGANFPEANLPQRGPDFPAFQIPFAEEERVSLLNQLFANWSLRTQKPVIVRVADDGTMQAWLDDSED